MPIDPTGMAELRPASGRMADDCTYNPQADGLPLGWIPNGVGFSSNERRSLRRALPLWETGRPPRTAFLCGRRIW
jgi:hypothetical protein